ncbi:MAG: UDP-N-acetylglucosamine--N-acetylmuramyl-(pentapeptide) pyrophosphoryl-undecaprenol N-acetylglucosamine transferase, partial [Kiritimatiellae bacterium]|nr:UDP-N-acetylglucosamine--N-acetylmuramyl-(pentapeptide) pyrophosphoryl-undecaprenol N-acetylglucosamine transferase [Kiritimatiellia bacterium]
LLAMGGYGSVGPVLAARTLGIPIVLHEANAIPGRAIEMLSRYAFALAISFESSAGYISHPRIVLTGFPVRQDIRSDKKEGMMKTSKFTVLVMGGSQGAHKLNEIASAAFCDLHLNGIPVQVIHLTGVKDEQIVRKVYNEAGVPCTVLSFLKEMATAYNQADMVIARAGAATCAEIAARAVPAVLVPLPTAMRDHQTANARSLAKSGGVEVMIEKDFTVEKLSTYVRECYRNPEKLDRMKEALKNIPSSNAAEKISDLLEKIVRSKSV